MKRKQNFSYKMSSAIYHKDAASRLRAQMRRKAISLYYNSRGPKMSIEDVAKKMQLPLRYVKKWIQRYEKLGLHGYVGQRQSAVLCIYKKNPNLTLTQLRVLLRKVGIILSNSELGNILKSLKHVLTDPGFMSASEDQVLKKLKKVTKVQPKTIIRMNQKLNEEQARESSEHSYALPVKSIFEDHNYVANPELFYEENDYSIYENVNKLVKYKTDLMNKIATVSKSLDKLFTEGGSANNNHDHVQKSINEFKISLLREQVLYLCLEMKGPKANGLEVVNNLPIPEVLISKWIEQAKNIKRFVHKKHVNKCCGKIQETIVRIKKLNPCLSIEQIKDILHNVRIELSKLKLERQINSVKYMICGPEDFVEKDTENISVSNDDIDYCIKVLSAKIEATNKKNERIRKDLNENQNNKQLSLQNIVESNSLNKHFVNSSDTKKSPSETKIAIVKSKFQEELADILDKNEKDKQKIKKLNPKNIESSHKNELNEINHLLPNTTFSHQVSMDSVINTEPSEKVKVVSETSIKLNGYVEDSRESVKSTLVEKSSLDINNSNILNYFSLVPKNGIKDKDLILCKEDQKSKHTEVNKDLCNNTLQNDMMVAEKILKESNINKVSGSKSLQTVLNNSKEVITLLNEQIIQNNSLCNNEKLNTAENQCNLLCNNEKLNTTEDQSDSLNQCSEKISLLKETNTVKLKDENSKSKEILQNTVQEQNSAENEIKVVKENLENNTFLCAKKKNVIKKEINIQQNSLHKSTYKKQKRKYSENDDIESEFEPIEDLSFMKYNIDSDIIMKEETDYDKKIMTEYIECEDNSVVIKYFLAK